MFVQVLLAKEHHFAEDQVTHWAGALKQSWLEVGDVLREAGQCGHKAVRGAEPCAPVILGQASPQLSPAPFQGLGNNCSKWE